MLTIKRYFLSLAVLLAACGTYALAVAPWVAPPEVRKKAQVEKSRPVRASSEVQEMLAKFFPPDAWERQNPKIVETEQCTLIIQDYHPTPDGHLELKPCTLIFYASGSRDPQTGETARRPIVLQAPAGAVLEFDQPLDLARAEFGRLEEGTLRGEITITSPATRADANDALSLTTRQVELKRDSIVTNHEVNFRYGPSFGSGRDLKIALAPKESQSLAGGESRRMGGVQSVTLARLERLSIAMPAGSLLGELAPRPAERGPAKSAPLEITCRGPFTFDMVQQLATFDDTVEVTRAMPGLPPDRLRCQRLALEFQLRADKNQREGAAKDTKAAGSPAGQSEELTNRIQRIVADGWPATLDAPSSGVAASAARIDYSLVKGRIELLPDKPGEPRPGVRRPPVTQVSLQQLGQHFAARQMAYDLVEPGRLGKLVAQGPGNLRLVQDQGTVPQPVAVRWKKQLVVQPDGGNQVISLWGEANVTAEGVAQFDAEEVHFWLLEVPAEMPPMQEPGKKPGRKRFKLIPDRLQATGKVQVRSPQLDAETARLEAWFIHVPLAPEPPASNPPPDLPVDPNESDPNAPLRPPVAQAGHEQPAATITGPLPSAAPPEPLRLQKFHVNGELIQLRLRTQGREFDLEDLVLRGHATIDETQTELPGQEPIHLSGDLLEVHGGTSPAATVELTGKLAEIGGRGLTLKGNAIQVHRGENRLWIDGPGEATLPAPEGDALPLSAASPAAATNVVREPSQSTAAKSPDQGGDVATPEKLHVVWQRGMTFDGQIATLEGEVQARTRTQLALSQSLQAALSQRIDFASLGGKLQPELGKLHLGGGVFVESRGYDDAGQKVSHEQMQTPSLTIDRVAGTLHADGPGWVSTVRKNTGALPGMARQPPASLPAGDGLISVHVAFERAIEGNLPRREIEFQHHVHTTYAPASEFTELIKAESVGQLPEQGVLMTSDRLKVTEMRLSPEQAWIELEASGNTLIDGKTFHVQASRVRFTSDKELLTIEGDGRADADVWYDTIPGQPRGHARARRFKYWVREEAFMGEDFSVGGFEWIGGTLKLPGLGNLPGKRKR